MFVCMCACVCVCVRCLTVYERFSFSSRCSPVIWAAFAPLCVCQWNCLRDGSVQCTLLLCELGRLGRLGSLVSDCVMCLRSVWRVRLLVLCVCAPLECWLPCQAGRRYHGAGCATEAFMRRLRWPPLSDWPPLLASWLPFSLCWPPPCEPTSRRASAPARLSLASFARILLRPPPSAQHTPAAACSQPPASPLGPANSFQRPTHRAFRAAVIIISAGQQLRPKTQTKPEASDYTALQCAS